LFTLKKPPFCIPNIPNDFPTLHKNTGGYTPKSESQAKLRARQLRLIPSPCTLNRVRTSIQRQAARPSIRLGPQL
jgi:hypothetical protein